MKPSTIEDRTIAGAGTSTVWKIHTYICIQSRHIPGVYRGVNTKFASYSNISLIIMF